MPHVQHYKCGVWPAICQSAAERVSPNLSQYCHEYERDRGGKCVRYLDYLSGGFT